jgi:hypothetical protein
LSSCTSQDARCTFSLCATYFVIFRRFAILLLVVFQFIGVNSQVPMTLKKRGYGNDKGIC